MMRWLSRLFLGTVLTAAAAASIAAPPIVIGYDSEIGHADSTSDDAVRFGIQAAIAEINAAGGVIGRRLELRELDNRSLPARGLENLVTLAGDPEVVAVFGGKYSPVVLQMLPEAKSRGIPLMIPWSAADAITAPEKPNVAFRVGLTDSMAMKTLLRAARQGGLRKGAVMAPRNAWGRSCMEELQLVLERDFKDMSIVLKLWHNRGDREFADQIAEARGRGAEFIIGALNEAEGAGIVQSMAKLPVESRIPIFSHWGITGGDFPTMAGPALNEVSLVVVQTIIPSARRDPRLKKLLDDAAARLKLPSGQRFTSAPGFVHAYDLTHLLALAIRAAGSIDRQAVMARLRGPLRHEGLLKAYRSPFSNPRQEALAAGELALGVFNARGVIVPWRPPASPKR